MDVIKNGRRRKHGRIIGRILDRSERFRRQGNFPTYPAKWGRVCMILYTRTGVHLLRV